MIPIATELLEQVERDDILSLDGESGRLIRERFTVEMREELERWVAGARTDEAVRFGMFMNLLDELGLLSQTEPTLNYEYWKSQLSNDSWGRVRGAALALQRDYVPSLSAQQKTILASQIESVLRSCKNSFSRVWLSWLRCQLSESLPDPRDYLLSTIKDYSADLEHQELVVDACLALVTAPGVSVNDLDSVQHFILSRETDRDNAAIVLEGLLASRCVSTDIKSDFERVALVSGIPELIEVVNEKKAKG
jgi:hypothetical protein